MNKTISISVKAAEAAEELNKANIEVSIICEAAILKAYKEWKSKQK